MMNSGLSTADAVLLTDRNNGSNNGGMWGGDGAWWIIILFLFCFAGWGGNGGFGGFGGGGAATQGALTREQACIDNNFNNLMRETAGISDAVNLGFANLNSTICNFAYENAGLINGVNNTINQGFNAMNISNLQTANAQNITAMQNANAIQSQLASCCCENRTGQMQLGNQMEQIACTANYNAATNTNAIIQNAHNDTDRVIARLDAMEMARKDETIANLRTQLAACGDQTTAQYIINQLTNVISPRAVPAYPASSPCGLGNWAPQVLANSYGPYSGYGFGGNCGCGCN